MPGNRVAFVATMNDGVSSTLDRMRDKFDKLGESKGAQAFIRGVGFGAGIGAWNLLGDAVGGAVGAIGDTIGMASDLNETMSKSAVIFGDDAAAVSAWGDTTARSLGLSKQQAVEARASLGNLFKTMGLGSKDVLDMSGNLVGLAGDLASFNNVDPTEALDKLRSGLVGEAEPLRVLGVQLTEASVAAEAVRLGLAKSTGQVSESAKVQARYSLILQQTKTAQGDFSRTSDGLANSQRILSAEIADAGAKIGTVLLPVAQKLVHVVADDLIPAGEKFIGTLADIAGPLARLNDLMESQGDHVGLVGAAWQAITKPLKDAGDAISEINYYLDASAGKSHSEFDEARHAAIAMGVSVDVLTAAWQRNKDQIAATVNTGADSLAVFRDHASTDFKEIETAAGGVGDATSAMADKIKVDADRSTAISHALHDQMIEAFQLQHPLYLAGAADIQAFGLGMRQKFSDIDQAGADLLDHLQHPMNTAARIAHLKGLLHSRRYAQGLASGDPAIVAETKQWGIDIRAELDGLRQKLPTYGKGAAGAYVKGWTDTTKSGQAKIDAWFGRVTGGIKPHSPPSAAPDMDQWGARYVDVIMGGFDRRARDTRASINDLLAYEPGAGGGARLGGGAYRTGGNGTSESTHIINIHLDGRKIAEVVGERQYYEYQRSPRTTVRT